MMAIGNNDDDDSGHLNESVQGAGELCIWMTHLARCRTSGRFKLAQSRASLLTTLLILWDANNARLHPPRAIQHAKM